MQTLTYYQTFLFPFFGFISIYIIEPVSFSPHGQRIMNKIFENLRGYEWNILGSTIKSNTAVSVAELEEKIWKITRGYSGGPFSRSIRAVQVAWHENLMSVHSWCSKLQIIMPHKHSKRTGLAAFSARNWIEVTFKWLETLYKFRP